MTYVDTRTKRWALLLPPIIASLIATAISSAVPLLSALLIALILGVVVINSPLSTFPLIADQAATTKLFLRIGVVLLGLRLPLGDLKDIGATGLLTVIITVCVTYAATVKIGAILGVDRSLTTLIAAGFSICGASAIAAVNDVVKAKQRDVGLAIAMVTLFGSAMILIVPGLSRLMNLSDRQSATWAGASIHEVAQVVAAASLVGTSALALATTVKLGRIALLAPAYMVTARRLDSQGSERMPLLPWFVIGFAIAACVRTVGVLPDELLTQTNHLTTILLAAAMFGLGLGIRGRDLWPLPLRILGLAACSTAVAATTSLAVILIG